MRNQLRALLLATLSVLAAIALGIASAFAAALAVGATALIVPGTGTPNPDVVGGYREHAWSRYIDGLACTDVDECADPDLVGIPYPASFWPLSFLPGWCVPGRCEKWNVSVGEGAEHLMLALEPFLDPDSEEAVFIFGYSQGGAVVANALTELAALGLSDDVKDRLKVVTIGGVENPDGGAWQRLAWLQGLFGDPLPVLDVSFDPAMPVNTGIATTSIGFEYDPVVYAPKYWGNVFAFLNMFAALDTVHGYYLAPNAVNDHPLPYGYTDETLAAQLDCGRNPGNCRTDSFGNSYIMIPATSLPLTDEVRSFADSLGVGWLAEPFIDLVEPVLREAVDLGFDWSGDPGVPSPASILPFKIFQNWLKVGVDFAVAAVRGIEAFVRNFIPEDEAATTQDSDGESATVSVAREEEPAASGGDASVVSLFDSETDAVDEDVVDEDVREEAEDEDAAGPVDDAEADDTGDPAEGADVEVTEDDAAAADGGEQSAAQTSEDDAAGVEKERRAEKRRGVANPTDTDTGTGADAGTQAAA